MIKLGSSDYPGLSEQIQCNHKGPDKKGRNIRNRERLEDLTMLTLKTEEGSTSQRICQWLLVAVIGKERDFR